MAESTVEIPAFGLPGQCKPCVLDDLVLCVLRNGFTAIEELGGSQVVAFLSQAHVDPDITIEIFIVDPALDGFGAAELIEPNRIDGS